MYDPQPMSRRAFLKALGVGTSAAVLPLTCGKRIRSADGHPGSGGKDFSAAYGIVPPLITPFTDDGAIDWDTYDRLVEWHVEKGVDGVFAVCGSSEYFTLSEDEAIRLADHAVKRSGGGIHVLAGSTLHDELDRNIAMTRRMWNETGVGGCFITTPRGHYREDGPVVDYFLAVHDAVGAQLFAYEIPAAGRYKFSPHALAQIGKKERFIALKDTSTKSHLPGALALKPVRDKLDAVAGTIKIMQANTKFLLASLDLGCTGGINTSANVAPGLFAKLYHLWKAGDRDAALVLHERILAIDEILHDGYMRSAKVALAMMGFPITPFCRLHVRRIGRAGADRLRRMVRLIERAEAEFEVGKA